MGRWCPPSDTDSATAFALAGEGEVRAIQRVGEPVFLVEHEGQPAVATGGTALLTGDDHFPGERRHYPLLAYAPAMLPEHLGDPAFCAAHGLRYPYVVGAMANGIASVELVEAAARGGLLGFFGSAGLSLERIDEAITRLQASVGDQPHGFNLIHSPSEPMLEEAVVDLYLRRGVRLVSASAYLGLTLSIVRYRTAGIFRDGSGEIVAPNRVVAKVSRVEVARKFLSPPPEAMLSELVEAGHLTREQMLLARTIPMAEDLTAEADSGGHTDNQPALTLVPTLCALRDRIHQEEAYARRPRIGAAGGLGTPGAVAAAFSMGAAYVLTGSINQSCVEAGTSDPVKALLAAAQQADVIMAPAADMFEMGVKVQVLKRGTMFPLRARKLFELYREYESLEDIPAEDRKVVERDMLRATFHEAWDSTRAFFQERDPRQITRAESDPRHKMALVFRSYLGLSSDWANRGELSRKLDYQVWCGPAMGAFNEWVKGSFLESIERRDAVTLAMNLLVGAVALTRTVSLRTQLAATRPQFSLPEGCDLFPPLPLRELTSLMQPEVHA